jgi:hypothetical protein
MTTKKTTWKKGQSGNPAGKQPGTRNKATMLVLSLMEDGAREITQAVVDAARLVLERLSMVDPRVKTIMHRV